MNLLLFPLLHTRQLEPLLSIEIVVVSISSDVGSELVVGINGSSSNSRLGRSSGILSFVLGSLGSGRSIVSRLEVLGVGIETVVV